jgi:fructose-1,6-bisphosphatase
LKQWTTSKRSKRFPAHDIIGEEMEERRVRDREYIWAVDPIDGTTNFVNGFPMFAASIGVLHRPSRGGALRRPSYLGRGRWYRVGASTCPGDDTRVFCLLAAACRR